MRRRWRWLLGGILGLLLLLAGAGAVLLLPRLDALRFLAALSEPVPDDGWLPPRFERLAEERLPGAKRTLVGRPEGTPPFPAVVVVHGITEQGIDDGRLVRLAVALQRAGLLVVVPEIGAMVHMANRDRDEDRLTRLLRALEEGALEGVDPTRVGVFGISVGGGFALTSVARHRLAGGRGPRALLLLGTPEEIDRVARDWFQREMPPENGEGAEFLRREAGLFARNALLRFAAPRLVPGEEGERVADWLAEAWRPKAPAPELSSALGRQLVALVDGPLPRDEDTVGLVLDATRDLLDHLSAGRLTPLEIAALGGVPCFLLHGVADPLVPVTELPRLAARLAPHTRVETLASRLVDHTELTRTDLWRHVVFVDDLLDVLKE